MMYAVRDQGLNVIAIPWSQLVVFLGLAVVIGVLAAVLPARRAARLDVLTAISADLTAAPRGRDRAKGPPRRGFRHCGTPDALESGAWMTWLVPLGTTLKHVQVREYVRDLIADLPEGAPAPVRARADAALRRRADDGAPGDRRARGRGAARAGAGARHVRLQEPPPGHAAAVVHRGRPGARLDDHHRDPAVTASARPDRASPRRSGITPGRRGHPLAAPAPARRRTRCATRTSTSTRSCCPGFLQTGLPESLYSLLAARGLRPTAAEDQLSADLANEVDADLLDLAHRRPGAAALAARAGRRRRDRGVAVGVRRRAVHLVESR